MMEDNNDNILTQIQELRSEADKNLRGNAYFTVAQKLDAMLAGTHTGDPTARLQEIRAQHFSAAPASEQPAAAEDTEKAVLEDIGQLRAEAAKRLHNNDYFVVAQKFDALIAAGNLSAPEARETLEAVRTRLSAAPAAPAVQTQQEVNAALIEEIEALRAEATERLQGDDYFSVSEKLDALIGGGHLNDAAAKEQLQAIRDQIAAVASASGATTDEEDELLAHIVALRAEASEKLKGNRYFNIAQRLDSVLASGGQGDTSASNTLGHIRSLLETEQSASEDNQISDDEAAATIVFPKANSFSAPQPTVAVRGAGNEDEEPKAVGEVKVEPEPEQKVTDAEPAPAMAGPSPFNSRHGPDTPEEKSGFDALTEASWRRVREVAGSDELPPANAMNGAATEDLALARREPVAETEAAAPEIAEPAPAVEAEAQPVEENEAQAAEADEAEIEHAPAPEVETASAGEEEPAPIEAKAAIEADEPAPAEAAVEAEEPAPMEAATISPTEPAAGAIDSSFKVTPQPVIINRPVRKERFARLKRLAKLPHLPKRKG